MVLPALKETKYIPVAASKVRWIFQQFLDPYHNTIIS